ncbi:MAG TPA: methylenetetrahydrofolate reductase, partial [Abditibacteriaceae bacterium]|nr:methylenetetrahydrofolate reductase [Abditibacteriaceae bacterium]
MLNFPVMSTRFSDNTNNRIDALFTPGHPTVSFEFFPPKDEAGEAQLMTAISELKPLRPHFISVTRT